MGTVCPLFILGEVEAIHFFRRQGGRGRAREEAGARGYREGRISDWSFQSDFTNGMLKG